MEDIRQLLNIFRNELNTAGQSFYAWKAINNLASSSKEIYNLLNKNSLSWNIINRSLINTFFITLGRIFDTDKESFSVHAFMRACINNIEQFSKESLRKRRIVDLKGDNPYWLDKFIEESYVPVAKDFQMLRGETSKQQKEYENIYKPIRHKIIAHTDKETIEIANELFNKTNIEQIEGFLQFLYQIEMIVFNLLENGRLSKIGDFDYNENDYIQKDIEGLLNKLLN
jgi:AbiU2